MMHVFKAFLTRLSRGLVFSYIRLPKRVVQWLAFKTIHYVLQHQKIKEKALSKLRKYLSLETKLLNFAITRGLGNALQGAPSELTPRASRIYKELASAIELQHRNNS